MGIASLCLVVGLAIHIWLWRQYPSRLVLRHFGKTFRPLPPVTPEEDGTVWPPAPERPSP